MSLDKLPKPIIKYIAELSENGEAMARIFNCCVVLSVKIRYILYHYNILCGIRKTLELPDTAFEILKEEYIFKVRHIYWCATNKVLGNKKTFNHIIQYYFNNICNGEVSRNKILRCLYNTKYFNVIFFKNVIYDTEKIDIIERQKKIHNDYLCLKCGGVTSYKDLPQCNACNSKLKNNNFDFKLMLLCNHLPYL